MSFGCLFFVYTSTTAFSVYDDSSHDVKLNERLTTGNKKGSGKHHAFSGTFIIIFESPTRSGLHFLTVISLLRQTSCSCFLSLKLFSF